jgi:uncharacterized repeat protein (TIGR01451 family)
LWRKGIMEPKRSSKRDQQVAHQITTVLRFALVAALLVLSAPGAGQAGGEPAESDQTGGLAVLTLPGEGTRLAITPPSAPPEAESAPHEPGYQAFLSLPLRFIANAGQTHPAVRFTVKGAGHTLFFTEEGVVFSAAQEVDGERVQSVVRLRFPGANPHPGIEGLAPLPGTANFFLGNDPAGWHAGVATFGAVIYRDLYPGVDLVYSGTEGHLKSEFRLAPGVDPSGIQMAYDGAQAVHLRQDGALVLQTPLGELIEAAPLVYQEANGARQEIPGRYILLSPWQDPDGGEGCRVGFRVDTHDPALPLVIDPVLGYSTYLGGSGDDAGYGIAVDDLGNTYVTGQTRSNDFFTTTNVISTSLRGNSDAFVTQIIRAGEVYTYGYSTYLGGSNDDLGYGIAVDGAGNAYVTGETESGDFPTYKAITDTLRGPKDVFVTQIISAGGVYTLGFSTYLGGNSIDYGTGIAVDVGCDIYVAGGTMSSDFFTSTNAIQPAFAGGYPSGGDAFVTQIISASGTYTYGYSSYLGGSGVDCAHDVAVDGCGSIYVTGDTKSSDFPTHKAMDSTYGGNTYYDAFVTQIISASGTYTYAYSTYLGGAFPDRGFGVVVDGMGNATVAGNTCSADFPTYKAVQASYGGGTATGGGDAFVTQIVSASGSYTYGYSSYLGGYGNDWGHDVSLDSLGNAIVAGRTQSSNFPTRYPVDGSLGGTDDAFVTQIISASGVYTYGYSTYLGGSGYDDGRGVAIDDMGNAYVTGQTQSSDFPTHKAMDTSLGGSGDAFVAKIGWGGLMISKTATPTLVAPGQTVAYTLIYTNDSPISATSVIIADLLPVPITYTHVSYSSSGAAITPTGSVSYTWQAANLAQGEGGIITIMGVLSSSLTPGTVITNTATITGAGAYTVPTNMIDWATVTIARAIYFPVIYRQ